jgi:ABC-type transporter Mla subunit MlaD
VNHDRTPQPWIGTLYTVLGIFHRPSGSWRTADAPTCMLRRMSVLPDPDALERIAGQLRGHADDLRRRAGSLTLAAERVRWRSTAAEAFRARVGGLSVQISRAASHVDGAAETLRHHAACVRHRNAVLAAAAAVASPGAVLVNAIEDLL